MSVSLLWQIPGLVVLVFFGLLNLAQLALMISAGFELGDSLRTRSSRDSRTILKSPFLPRVSLLVPAYNEEAMVADTVTSMLALDFPNLEVVVVNDGSSDATMTSLVDRFGLAPGPSLSSCPLDYKPVLGVYRSPDQPRLVVIDKHNGGKADALNAALAHASGDLVCAVDADTIIEANALERLVPPFIADPELIAAGGSVRPLNGCRMRYGQVVERGFPTRFLAGVQSIEYTRAFLFGRLGWNRLGDNIIVSGAFGLFNREMVIGSEGYLEETVGEDMELILRLRRLAKEAGRPANVKFVPEPMAWTEVPESIRTLARQRNRWQRGLWDTLVRHRSIIGRRRYGMMGRIVLPYYVLELLAPLFEAIGLVLLSIAVAAGAIDTTALLWSLVIVYVYPTILSLVSLSFQDLLDGEHLAPRRQRRRVRWILLEQFGYRQATVVWRLWGMVHALRGDLRWGAQERRGIAEAE